MDLHSGRLYWMLINGLGTVVPPLTKDTECDVAIIGGGITGALVAEAMSAAGLDVVVLDRRDLGQGSTAASTALLQYDIDTPLFRLTSIVGESHARRAYWLGLEAIADLKRIARRLQCPFQTVPSLYFAAGRRAAVKLKLELRARRMAGLDVDWLSPAELRSGWGMSAHGAIRSPVAGQTDPYRLCHAVLQECVERGVRVHDRTHVTEIREERSSVRLMTDRRARVRAGFVVHASGYEAVRYLPRGIVSLHSTYAMISEPVKPPPPWTDGAIAWEFADRYLYARWNDGRMIVGGEDEPFQDDRRRDRLIGTKTGKLVRKVARLVPGLALEPAFSWAGTFGSTADGLGYIGPLEPGRRIIFALGFGGNGITYSQIAGRLLTDLVLDRANPDAEIFRFGR